MNTQEQLRWQDRFAVPAAVAAFVAVVAQIATIALLATALDDRAGIEPLADEYLSIDERPGQFIAGGVARAVGALAIGVVFYYLFRLIRARGGAVPKWFVYLVYAGPLLFAVGALLQSFDQVDTAQQFTDQNVIRGDAGEEVAENLSDDTSPAVFAPTFAGTIGVAFLFVMLPLRARAVGLLSPFMAILGVICGALLVLPLVPAPIMTAFWLGAMGLLFLDRWPGGRGPAWESGESEPWPAPAQRRGLFSRPERPAQDDDPDPGESLIGPTDSNGTGDSEDIPDRPASRKRRRKG